MSSEKTSARPRQVIVAGGLGVVGSALVVLSLFDTLQRIRSVEMRTSVEEFLAEPPGDGLGVSTGWVLDVMHGMVLFNGALAAITLVLAVYVVQRHQVARVVFSIAAALLLLTSALSGGVMAMLVAFAATMLWSRPARDWFAGRDPAAALAGRPRPDRPQPEQPQSERPTSERGLSERADGGTTAGAASGWPPPPAAERRDPETAPPGGSDGQGGPAPAAYPFGSRPDPGWAPPGVAEPTARPAGAGSDRRPPALTAATVLTCVFAGATAMVYLVVVALLMFAQQPLVEALQAEPRYDDLQVSTRDLLAFLWVMSAVAIFWSVSAVALAALAFRRIGWARNALVVSALFTLLVSLMAFPFGLVHAAAAAATLILLFRDSVRSWFARGPSSPPPPGPPRHDARARPQDWPAPPPQGWPAPPPQGPPPPARTKPPVW